MSYFDTRAELASRKLPDLFKFEDGTPVTIENAEKRRKELLHIMQREVYGYMPKPPAKTDFEILETESSRCCAGKAIYKKIKLSFPVNEKTFSFTFRMHLPKAVANPPFVVIENFRSVLPDEYVPSEELIDRGIGFAVFCHKEDITSDDGNFSDKLSGLFYPDGERKEKTDIGKIAMWAYCQSRVLDYVLQNENVDTTRIAAAGHSRLGKTSLLAAACDERFTCAYSNDSGCSGAAISRNKIGESIEDITRVFPFWFCPSYSAYAKKEYELPCDQHFLIASIAPRKVYVASAVEDTWADPASEYLCCVAASHFWKLYGIDDAFDVNEKIPRDEFSCRGKNIGYHLRRGVHYFSRYDWNKFLDFFLA